MNEVHTRKELRGRTAATRFRVSPSSLGFGLGCRRCFGWALRGETLPSGPMSRLFGQLDGQQKRYFVGKPAAVLHPELPAGVLQAGGRVASAAVSFGELELQVAGNLDARVAFEDGSVGVVDFKTTSPRDGLAENYKGQLNAYAWALRHPAKGAPAEVSRLGLLVVSFQELLETPLGLANTVGTTWVDVDDDPGWFENLLGEVAELAVDPDSVPPGLDCAWCALLEG